MNQVIKNNQNTTKLLNYLKSSQVQYPVLNKKQEREMIKKYKNNRDELNRLLFMHNIKIVFDQAKKYKSKTNDFDNLVQDGMLGLAEAAKRFDPKKNIKFRTYATLWVRKWILANFYGKQVELDKHSISMNSPTLLSQIKNNSNTEMTVDNCINDKIDPSYLVKTVDDELSSAEQKDICKNLMDKLDDDSTLSSTDKKMFIDMFYNHEKSKDIAEKYNTTTQNLMHVKNKILSKFKNILQAEYDVTSFADMKI